MLGIRDDNGRKSGLTYVSDKLLRVGVGLVGAVDGKRVVKVKKHCAYSFVAKFSIRDDIRRGNDRIGKKESANSCSTFQGSVVI